MFETIARLADGDARMGITTLWVAAQKASSKGLSNIPRRLVEDSISEAELENARKTFSKLNHHQRVLYGVLEENGPLIQKELYARYTEEHDDPVTLRYLRENHLPKLEHYNLVNIESTNGTKLYTLLEPQLLSA